MHLIFDFRKGEMTSERRAFLRACEAAKGLPRKEAFRLTRAPAH